MPPPITSTSNSRPVSSAKSRITRDYLIVAVVPEGSASQRAVRSYWDAHIHDFDITTHPPGSPGFFADLEHYHFEKLHHLPRLVPFDRYRGRLVLEVGCGAGIDLMRFARNGAKCVGIDVAPS